jgi:hypothetical protein
MKPDELKQVKSAINELEYASGKWENDEQYAPSCGTVDCALAALRSYTPVPDDIKKAIETLDALCSGQIEHKQHDSETKCPICAAHDLAIQALRQMKQEPCQWCADAEKYMIWVVYEKSGQRYTGKPELCPCCGRPLPAPPEKGDDK